jgi:uncharacterized protein (TIRG00374 family)
VTLVPDEPQKAKSEKEELAEEMTAESPEQVLAEAEPKFFAAPKRIIQTLLAVVALTVAIYVLFPRLVGLEDAFGTIEKGDLDWVVVALLFNILAFAAYVALFRGVVAEKIIHLRWAESYQITMAGLAATRIFSAGGAGGIFLTYWALRKAGMERRLAAGRMVAFLVILYSVYMFALIVFGVLLRTGVLPGGGKVSTTIIPAALAGAAILIVALLALLPGDIEGRIEGALSGRFAKFAKKAASAPATFAQGTRDALAFAEDPKSGILAFSGAIGFWAANIGILWASFQAFHVEVPFGVIVQGFFLGMVANLFPLAPGGVGAVDAGMIGAFVLFGIPAAEVFAAVLTYRVIAFWLPIPPGIIAFFQLRHTVARWEAEGRSVPLPAPVKGSGASGDG